MENKDFLEHLGYSSLLAILPFDHRSFFEELFDFSEPLTGAQHAEISNSKRLIYAGYEKSLALGIPRDGSAILVDDVFGLDILTDAKAKGYTVLQSIEVSGGDHFAFQHGDEWKSWVEKVKPTFVKALVRYNPGTHRGLNQKSLAGLRELSDYAHAHGYKFLIEPLVPASEADLALVGGDKGRYDRELRPGLTVRMITDMQDAGVEPDVWKIEGMFTTGDYAGVVAAARRDGRSNVGTVSLGRNETDEVVETWLRTGAQVPGVIGFAVGRTIFLNALMRHRSGEYTEDQATTEIAERFFHFYNVFKGA